MGMQGGPAAHGASRKRHTATTQHRPDTRSTARESTNARGKGGGFVEKTCPDLGRDGSNSFPSGGGVHHPRPCDILCTPLAPLRQETC